MNNQLSFAFLLSVYKNDNPIYLDQCLESILNQSVEANETVIVVEGTISKEIKEVLNKYNSKIQGCNIYYLKKQYGPLGYGLPACLNFGISKIKSNYVLRIDSDDINRLDRVEKTIEILKKNPDIKLGGSNVQEFDEHLKTYICNRNVPEKHKDILKYSKFRNPFNGPAVFFEKHLAIKLGGYPLVGSNEDYCFWVSFLKYNIQTYNIQEDLVSMRAGKGIIKRRSSYRYIKGEWQSLRYIYGIGYYNLFNYIFHLTFRTLIRILPFNILHKLYTYYLRK